MEALKSPLMGLFEKRRARNFFIYVQDYNEADPKTHKGLDLTRATTKELISWVSTPFFSILHYIFLNGILHYIDELL
jgi:RAB protein geranylgeranyltransferase component A